MEGVETDGWVTEMVRYVICPDEDISYICCNLKYLI